MKKILPLIILFVFSFSAIHADITYKLSDDGTLTISGTGDMHDSGDAPWYSRRSEIKKIVIEDGVTNIGRYAFDGCHNLASIEIPNSVTSIGNGAFYHCDALPSITIPNSVTSIGQNAFRDCTSLTSVTIPNSLTSLGYAAFRGCTSLTSIEIPNSVTSLGEGAFRSCKSLTSIEISNSVTSIGTATFYFCENLASIEIPSSVTSIGDGAFYGCNNLPSVTIPNSVMSVGEYAFRSCDNLTSITFNGSTPPKFGDYVFEGVNNSVIIYVPSISIDAYKEALKDYGFSNIQANPKQLFLTGNNFYLQDSQIDDIDVSFTRNFSGNWEAIYLPFSLEYKDWKDDFKVARINAVRQYDTDDDGKIDRTEFEFVKMTNDESVIYPNTPYLILAKTPGNKTISVKNTTVYESKANSIECSTTTEQFIFTGTYKRISYFDIIGDPHYVLDDSGLNIKRSTSAIDPYRWYMKRENRNSAYGINNNNTAKEISIRVVGEETTGIANIQLTSPNTQTYDLNGRKVNENNLKPGMYVKNGRKFVIK